MSYDADRYPLASLLPQTGVMCLLDRLLEVSDESAKAQLQISRNSLFSLPDGSVPAWVGLEYMAQTIAAWSGYHCLRQGEQIRIGLLLGTRHYDSRSPVFRPGSVLTIRAHKLFEAANHMCVFECVIEEAGELARARLNVLLPPDLRPYLQNHQEFFE